MLNENKLREWATPLTMGAFALSAVTGILMFFKMSFGLVKPAHEWLSVVLVIGGILHLSANWRLSVQYALRPIGRSILIFFFLLICLSLLPLGEKDERRPFSKISDALIQSPLSAVAQLANRSSEQAINILNSKAVKTEGKEQTIKEIAVKNNKTPMSVLEMIF